MIIKCKCEHKQQDALHGNKNRVMNEFKDSRGDLKYRCTVCGTERKAGEKG